MSGGVLHPSGQKPKGQAGACPDRTRAIACTLRVSHEERSWTPVACPIGRHRGISRPPADSLTPADPLLNSSRHRHSRPPGKGWPDGMSDHPFSGLSIRRRAVLPRGYGVRGRRAPSCRGPGRSPGTLIHRLPARHAARVPHAPRLQRRVPHPSGGAPDTPPASMQAQSAAQSRGGTITSQSAGKC